ncbi:MAG TPA: GspH/FimT family pseudopilin [Vicinamibacterales bacterium]|nr:GspH/FimT family pseudopilin [Vicinamibacterales bacterium]
MSRFARYSPRPATGTAGYTFVEALFVCAVVAVVTAVAVPVSLAGVNRARGWAGTRFVAARLVRARAEAVGRGASVALRFDGDGERTTLASFVDANRNGVLTREIDAGMDPPLDDPVPLASLFPGVVVSDEGGPRLFSFSPDGTATTGSIYLQSRDGSRFAVRVLGATARVRIERYVTARDAWVEVF